jgi:hypothetical protein
VHWPVSQDHRGGGLGFNMRRFGVVSTFFFLLTSFGFGRPASLGVSTAYMKSQCFIGVVKMLMSSDIEGTNVSL